MKTCTACEKKKKIEKFIDEYKKGKITDQSQDGPVITNKKQNISMAFSGNGNMKCSCK